MHDTINCEQQSKTLFDKHRGILTNACLNTSLLLNLIEF